MVGQKKGRSREREKGSLVFMMTWAAEPHGLHLVLVPHCARMGRRIIGPGL